MNNRAIVLLLLVCLMGAAMVEQAEAWNSWPRCRCAKWCNYKWEYPAGKCGWWRRRCCRRHMYG